MLAEKPPMPVGRSALTNMALAAGGEIFVVPGKTRKALTSMGVAIRRALIEVGSLKILISLGRSSAMSFISSRQSAV
jgi:hypothetical protein